MYYESCRDIIVRRDSIGEDKVSMWSKNACATHGRRTNSSPTGPFCLIMKKVCEIAKSFSYVFPPHMQVFSISLFASLELDSIYDWSSDA